MQRNFMERRRRQPSYLMPSLFFVLEQVAMWLILSIFNWNTSPMEWHVLSYPVFFIWFVYSAFKLYFVLKRQKAHHD